MSMSCFRRLLSDSFWFLMFWQCFYLVVSSRNTTKFSNALVAACPYYFTELPGTGSCYMRVFKDRLNWMDAEESCMSVHNKTHLVVIDNAVEHDAIVTWLKKIGGNNNF